MALPHDPQPTDGPALASSHPTPTPCHWFSHIAAALDPRSAPRFALLLLGVLLATGRRTVTAWLRAARITEQFRPAYTTVAAVGRCTEHLAARLLYLVLQPLLAETDRILLGIDDTPTQRYGPHVQGAGLHHNPTPGPRSPAAGFWDQTLTGGETDSLDGHLAGVLGQAVLGRRRRRLRQTGLPPAHSSRRRDGRQSLAERRPLVLLAWSAATRQTRPPADLWGGTH